MSLGLGATELAAPDWIKEQTGARVPNALIRTLGVREILSGLGVLTLRRKAGALWARVGGDGLDLAVLATGLRRRSRTRALVSMGMILGVASLDVFFARQLSGQAA